MRLPCEGATSLTVSNDAGTLFQWPASNGLSQLVNDIEGFFGDETHHVDLSGQTRVSCSFPNSSVQTMKLLPDVCRIDVQVKDSSVSFLGAGLCNGFSTLLVEQLTSDFQSDQA